MKLYAFASNNLTNIWAGVGAGRWAVARSEDPTFSKVRAAKAARMPVGAFGLLYCTEVQSFTVPFVVYSGVSDETVKDIWPEEWILPFHIKPLGTPNRRMRRDKAKDLLPSVQARGTDLNKLIPVPPTFAFNGSEIGDDDWAVLIKELAS